MKKGGWCVWVTGLPGSGKSVIVEVLTKKLKKENVVIDATGNRRRYRDNTRKMIPRFIGAYIRYPLGNLYRT